MKTRLLGLALLCLGLFAALSLMVTEDLPVDRAPLPGYVQSAALPPQAAAAPSQPDTAPAPDPVPDQLPTPQGDTRQETLPLLFSARLPYYRRAYYAFHLSDEAG